MCCRLQRVYASQFVSGVTVCVSVANCNGVPSFLNGLLKSRYDLPRFGGVDFTIDKIIIRNGGGVAKFGRH